MTGLQTIDWVYVFAFFALSLAVGLAVSARAGRSSSDFFLAGRNMPWWLLGVSMVATTFSTDTPNLVTGLVRESGVSGNWVWWAFLLTGMLTVFVYARLWRRSNVMTDLEFYELRYSGRSAAFLRGFRAVYLGVLYNVMVMAMVSLAAIKIGAVMFAFAPWQTLLVAAIVTVAYSMLGGLTGVLITDLVQFGVAMFGSIVAAYYALGHADVGGLSALLQHPAVAEKINLMPNFNDPNVYVPVLVIPLAVQWWSAWYPGSEPGGGGYIAQRMLSARNENHAIGATLFFNVAHYALRPWPWIIVALCSLVVFPDVESLRAAFPNADPQFIKNDLAYPAMLKLVLPPGMLGLVVASLAAAFMSTISTHLNWGSSYVVNDVYRRFVRPDASEKQMVAVGRISTFVMMVLACGLALLLEDAVQAFMILLQVGAGTGLLFILRWFWWRINAASELTAMIVSFCVAVGLNQYNSYLGRCGDPQIADWIVFVIVVGVTTPAWLIATFATRPTRESTLLSFYRKVQPGGPGWRRIERLAASDSGETAGATRAWSVPTGVLCMFLGCVTVYAALFATGCWLYSRTSQAMTLTIVGIVAGALLAAAWRRLRALNERG